MEIMVSNARLPRLVILLALLGSALCDLHAAPLEQAWVNKIINDVRVLNGEGGASRPAKLQDVIKDDVALTTGVDSRAELLFQDKTLTRLGAGVGSPGTELEFAL